MAYCTDAEVIAQWAQAGKLGVNDFTAFHTEATSIIEREVEYVWYRGLAAENSIDWRATVFSAAKLKTTTQLKRAAVYLTVALLAEYISRGEDEFTKTAERYRKYYAIEIERVLQIGLDYDWDASTTLESGEKYAKKMPRRLKRA